MVCIMAGCDKEIQSVLWPVARLVGSSLFVGLGRSIMLLLLGLVRDGIASGLEAVVCVSIQRSWTCV